MPQVNLMSTQTSIDLAAIRERLSTAKGKAYWRSLEELAETPEFQELLRREFPRQANAAFMLNRRDFLKFTAAALALAGLAACSSQPAEKIVPYIDQPEKLIPGKPLFFATALTLAGYATGVLVESHEGRPTKIEGNPDHPASLGATDSFAQAEILTLYDPDRSQHVLQAGKQSDWDQFLIALGTALNRQDANQGAGLRILTGTVTSPTLASQLDALLKKYPSAKWHQYEPVNRDNVLSGSSLAFGKVVEPHYHFDKAQVILSLDADFLRSPAGGVRYTRAFSDGRRVRNNKTTMNRLYALESTPTITGSVADHRLPQRANQIESFARTLANLLGVKVDASTSNVHSIPDKWLNGLVKDLQTHLGSSLVVAGDHQPPAVHALAHAINDVLGNTNNTVIYTAPVAAIPVNQTESLQQLAADLDTGSVQITVIIGNNPVYTAPADLDFANKLSKAALKLHLGLYEDETSTLCDWHIPETHALEGWSDTRAYDGTVSIVQPLILPLYGGKSAHELVAALLGDSKSTDHDIVQGYWKNTNQASDFDSAWKAALHDGLIQNSAAQAVQVKLASPFSLPLSTKPASQASGLEIIFQPDAATFDGRFANNGWLQELPRPLSLLTWDNVAAISPATAQRLQLTTGDVVELRYKDRTLRVPVWIQPGHADESVTLTLGYGRKNAGKIGTGVGYNAYALRTADTPWFDSGVEIGKTGEQHPLISTQGHNNMENRDLIRATTLDNYTKHPNYVRDSESKQDTGSLYPPHSYTGHAWGMAIDTSACVGCNACIIACQAENNIPTVGKDEVAKGREMHWLRVDRYFSGDLDNPEMDFQPVPCMQCENAPCEPVCPVGATVHSDEGLNDQVYNRCIGTKYCSNNCPYKVRRFNFFQYADYDTPSLKLLHNPDVTVRSLGVMEKCTYCVQRVQNVKITADREGRAVLDNEIKTACQQVCPAQAIVFGDINDPKSQVSQLKAQPHNYTLLSELNTRPRTSYLGKVRNPNPEIGE
jgi:molybdopterin-containing oxidoreductase family iron-sulfur binding subunit